MKKKRFLGEKHWWGIVCFAAGLLVMIVFNQLVGGGEKHNLSTLDERHQEQLADNLDEVSEQLDDLKRLYTKEGSDHSIAKHPVVWDGFEGHYDRVDGAIGLLREQMVRQHKDPKRYVKEQVRELSEELDAMLYWLEERFLLDGYEESKALRADLRDEAEELSGYRL